MRAEVCGVAKKRARALESLALNPLLSYKHLRGDADTAAKFK